MVKINTTKATEEFKPEIAVTVNKSLDIITNRNDYYIVKNCIEHSEENSNIDILYSDEDKIEETLENRCEPHFKPDFAPETLACHNYITHFVVLKKELMDKLVGFRKEYNGAQDFDLVLRASEETNNIIHISNISIIYVSNVYHGIT